MDTGKASEDLRTIGLIGWAVLLGLCFAWEGLGLVFGRQHWPSISDLLRTMSRPVIGRWILLALWLWLGWHLFVRGWHPFLRGTPQPGTLFPNSALTMSQIFRQVVIPMSASYATLLVMIWTSARGPGAGSGRRAHGRAGGLLAERSPGLTHVIPRVVQTLVTGYVAYLVVILLYYAAVADQTTRFLRAAATGGAFITFVVALPGLLLLSAAEAIWRLRRSGVDGGPRFGDS
jgi:hypothetical protein